METSTQVRDEFTEMLEGMTKQELVKYAQMTFSLSVTARYTKQDLITAIKQARAKYKLNDQLMLGEASEGDLPPGYAQIQLHRSDTTKGMKSVIVGLNGNFASLPIGVKFGCPLEYVHILENAVRMEYEQDNSVHPPELIEKEVGAYPFTIHNINPHTPESKKAAGRKRGFRGRAPIEQRRATA